MTHTVEGVTARKTYYCDAADGRHTIEPGHRYLRHVEFPGDVNSADQPWVLRECVACAVDRDTHAGSLIGGACTMFCCGDVPCALPFKHDGDHSCRRCASLASHL